MKLADLNLQDKADRQVVFVAGSRRSGTTWLQEIINYRGDHRILFEPFFHARVPLWPASAPVNAYLRADSDQPLLTAIARQILQGELRNSWVDQFTPQGSYHRRLIKDIRTNLMLKWLCALQPGLKLVFLLRHPCAVVSSQLTVRWAQAHERSVRPPDQAPGALFIQQAELMQDFLAPFAHLLEQTQDPFDWRILYWAIENYVPLRQFAPHELHLIFYEELCTEPEATLARLFQFLNLPLPTDIAAVMNRPSALAREHSAILNGASLLDAWRSRVEPAQIRRAVALLRHFGLDEIYNDAALPNRQRAEQWLQQN